MTEQGIYNYLKEHGVYAEVYSEAMPSKTIVVLIEWGDWKHEHWYCDYLMEQKGYSLIETVVTEEDGSDCYSAEHFYEKED